jgi:TetR/AcrR family transcriptional regulator, mexJK operon transcriptional repressor
MWSWTIHRTRPSSTRIIIGQVPRIFFVNSRLSDRSARKREAILEAATELFLTREYAGTSMEDVASAASVSKQTVYKHFSDKQSLFREVALGTVGQVGSDFQAEIAAAAEAADVRAALQALARSYVNAVVRPDVLRRRQLVLREAGRFPDMARMYHDSGPRRTIGALAAVFTRLAERGKLAIDDPQVAATQFAFLVIGEPLDTAMFRGVRRGRSRRELNALADAGVDVFLAAYGTRLSSVTR